VTAAGDVPTGADGERSYSIKGEASSYSDVVDVAVAT
jgi:hypothetical protein